MTTAIEINGQQIINTLQDLSIQDQNQMEMRRIDKKSLSEDHDYHGVCAICLNKIVLQETALVKGCEHAYCVTCILQWATYQEEPTCPQCKHPFDLLSLHRSLDGSIHDYMFEESVCLLLRASWFTPLVVESHDKVDYELEDYYPYEYEDDDDLDEVYLGSSSTLRIGNRRWGDNGYVRAGRQEARPVYRGDNNDDEYVRSGSRQEAWSVYRPNVQDSGSSGSSREPKKKEAMKDTVAVGRRAKRTLKRAALDKAAAAKHEERLARLGWN